MPIAPLRSKFVGARAPQPEEQWPAAGEAAGDLLSTKAFYFAERRELIDLEAIRHVDLERVEKDVDVEALQAHLEALVYGRLAAQ